MERIVYRLTLDAKRSGIQKTLQGFETADNMSRRIAVSIDGLALDENVVAMAYVTLPEAEEPSINECTIEDNTIIYDMLPIVVEGITEVQFKVIDASVNGPKKVLASPKIALEVTQSGMGEGGVPETTFTALEVAVAKAHAVYNKRLERIELDDSCVFRAYYADGTIYEDDSIKTEIEDLMTSVNSVKESEINAKASAKNARESEVNAKRSEVNAKEYMENAFAGTPEGYDELVDTIRHIDIVETTDKTMPKTKDGVLQLIEMNGNTEQRHLPTIIIPAPMVNVGDCVKMINGYYSGEDGLYGLSSNRICSLNPIPCKERDRINVEVEKEGDIYLICYNEDGFTETLYALGKTASFTILNGTTKFHLRLDSENEITPESFGKIKLTINGKHVVPVRTRGKNQFDESQLLALSGWELKDGWYTGEASELRYTQLNYGEFEENTQYAISFIGKTNSNDTELWARFVVTYTDGTDEQTGFFGHNFAEENVKFVSSEGKTIKYVTFTYGSNRSMSIKDLQIEKNNEATPYRPYTESVVYLYLDKPLAFADRIVKKDGAWCIERNTHEEVLSAGKITGFGESSTVGNSIMYNPEKTVSASKSEKAVMSTHFYGVSWNDKFADLLNLRICADTAGILRVYDASSNGVLTSLSDATSLVRNNEIHVQYKVATPTYEALDDDAQIALNSLKTFDDTTIIEADSYVAEGEVRLKCGTSKTGALTLENRCLHYIADIERANMHSELKDMADTTKLNTYTSPAQLGLSLSNDWSVPNIVSALPNGSMLTGDIYNCCGADENLLSQTSFAHSSITIKRFSQQCVEIIVTEKGSNAGILYYCDSVDNIIANDFTYNEIAKESEIEDINNKLDKLFVKKSAIKILSNPSPSDVFNIVDFIVPPSGYTRISTEIISNRNGKIPMLLTDDTFCIVSTNDAALSVTCKVVCTFVKNGYIDVQQTQ